MNQAAVTSPVNDMAEFPKPRLRRRRILERPRLIRALDRSHARVRMLVAGAGYGKTTLAEQWARDRKSRGCGRGARRRTLRCSRARWRPRGQRSCQAATGG